MSTLFDGHLEVVVERVIVAIHDEVYFVVLVQSQDVIFVQKGEEVLHGNRSRSRAEMLDVNIRTGNLREFRKAHVTFSTAKRKIVGKLIEGKNGKGEFLILYEHFQTYSFTPQVQVH